MSDKSYIGSWMGFRTENYFELVLNPSDNKFYIFSSSFNPLNMTIHTEYVEIFVQGFLTLMPAASVV